MKNSNNKQSLWKTLNEAGGFSLAEVMVAAGILGILSLAITEMTSNIAKSQRTMEQKFELGSVLSDIEFALRSKQACENNFRELTVSPSGVTLNSIVDGSTAKRVLVSSVANQPRNILGNISNGFTVSEIRMLGYASETLSPANSNYVLPSHFSSINTFDENGDPVVRRTGTILLRITFLKGFAGQSGRTAQEQEDFQKLTAAGPNIVVHNFKLRVTTDNANEIISCQSGDVGILAAACGSLGGKFDAGDGRCREINLFQDTTDGDSFYGITSRNNLKVVGGLAVGTTNTSHADNVEPAAGSLQVSGNATVGGTADITGNLSAMTNVGIGGAAPPNVPGALKLRVMNGDSRFDNSVGIGGVPIADHNLRVVGAATVSTNMGIGGVADPAFRLRVLGGSSTFQGGPATFLRGTSQVNINTAADTNNRINLNPNSSVFQEMTKGAAPRVRIQETGEILISNSNVDSALRVEIGGVSNESSTYRPIRVFNQPINNATAGTSTFRAINTEIDAELTTKGWVRRMVFGTVYESNPARIHDVIANMANYAQHQPWNAVAGGICNSLRVRNVGVNTTSYTICNYDGVRCNCEVNDCSTAGSACNTLHTGTLTATGAVTVGGNLSVAGAATITGRILSGSFIRAGDYIIADTYLRALDYVQAGTYMVAGTFVQAPKIRATSADAAGGPAGNGGICGTTGCATRFGKQHCPGQGVVVGIHRGTIACATQTNNGGGAVQWPTFEN